MFEDLPNLNKLAVSLAIFKDELFMTRVCLSRLVSCVYYSWSPLMHARIGCDEQDTIVGPIV